MKNQDIIYLEGRKMKLIKKEDFSFNFVTV